MEAKVSPEEYRQLERSLMEKTLDRAASDPEWKQQLLDDPQAAMAAADFPEAQQIQEMRGKMRPYDPESEEVRGHGELFLYEVCHNFTHFVNWEYLYVRT